MAADDSARLARLLEQALEVPADARADFLADVCAADGALRDELESLLSAHAASSDYFERLAGEVLAPALQALAEDADEGLAPGTAVSHYQILERLGAGGMGVVYSAFDLSLGRVVALKFLPRHLTSSPAARARFLGEAKAASLLDHPNIGVVHEAATAADGRFFIVMTHYEGETLERRIARGPLTVDQAATVAWQIAHALAAAHRKGIIHRDVKPSNILITVEGVAKLLDFGVAKMAGTNLTGQGPMPGTIGYMSPEQTRGETLDHRTDLWGLGVVLCEMLTGVRPFRGENDRLIVHAIRHDPWCHGDKAASGQVAPAMGRVIERCLQKEARRRYGSAEELAADLKEATALDAGHPSVGSRSSPWSDLWLSRFRHAVVAGISGLLMAGMLYPLAREPARVDLPNGSPEHRLAVLPLVGPSPGARDSYLATGITTELITRLSRLKGLSVIARSSVLPYTNAGKSPAEIVEELGLDMLLEVDLQPSHNQLRLTAHLIDSTGARLWDRSYSVDLRDLEAVQLDVVRRVAGVLRDDRGMHTAGDTIRTTTAPPAAYTAYLKGRYFLDKLDEDSVRTARDYFRQALDLDPTYAPAWTGWSDTLDVLAWLSAIPASDAYAQSQAAAKRALQLDPDLPEAHVSLAKVLFRHHFQFDAAADHLRRAIELNPSHAEARQHYAACLRIHGRFDEALEEARAAAALDPLSPGNLLEIGITLYLARRYDEALDQFMRLLQTRPDFGSTYFFVALTHLQRGEHERALATLDRATPATNGPDVETLRAYIQAVTGREAEARDQLSALERLAETEEVSAWHPAIVHLGLGEHSRALDLLELAFEERAWQMPLLPVEPILDPLRSNPRFIALANRVRGGPVRRTDGTS